MKNIFRITMLMFVAAATLFAASCSKEEEDAARSVSESQLVGLWGFPQGHQFQAWELDIKADHTMSTLGAGNWTWSLDGNKFVAVRGNGLAKLELTIQSATATQIKFSGEYQAFDGDGNMIKSQDISSTLTSLLLDPAKLSEVIVGNWKDNVNYHRVREDGTCTVYNIECTWSVSGSTFTAIQLPPAYGEPETVNFSLVLEAKRIKVKNEKVEVTFEGTMSEMGTTETLNCTFTSIN